MSTIPKNESLLHGADLNGHVNKVRDDAVENCGNHGHGIRNKEVGRILFLLVSK